MFKRNTTSELLCHFEWTHASRQWPLSTMLSLLNSNYDLITRSLENFNKLDLSRQLWTPCKIASALSRLIGWNSNHIMKSYTLRVPLRWKSWHILLTISTQSVKKNYLEAFGNMLDMLEMRSSDVECKTVAIAPNSSNGSYSRRLPRIKLTKFSGNYVQWNHFRDLFTSMIMDNNKLSAVEKFNYLKMSLTGELSQLLKNVLISGENLIRCLDTLVTYYKNKQILIDAKLLVLFAIRKVKIKSASDLKRLLADVKEALGLLESLNCQICH